MHGDDSEETKGHRVRGPLGEITTPRIALVVPKSLVKKIKDALEAQGDLDKNVKIRPAQPEENKVCLGGPSNELRSDVFLIPTKLSVRVEQSDPDFSCSKHDLLQSLGFAEFEEVIGIVVTKQATFVDGILAPERGYRTGPSSHESSACETPSVNPLARSIGQWLRQFSTEEAIWPFTTDLVLSYSWTYMVYPPLLLLPPSALSNLTSIFASKDQSLPKDLTSLWCCLSKDLRISNVALNAPILANTPKDASIQGRGDPEANILRSPTGLMPLYGDFGPALLPTHIPTITDFSSAFWCTARQNGIFQTWAPRYTMFSRGNISEKARILSFATLKEKQLQSQAEETSAVDLHAGIGYFAFSYAKAGVGKVICWEINPWSVEGLKRGAKRNGWAVNAIENIRVQKKASLEEERFIVFEESNEHAARRMAVMKDIIPPVRHVNCGLLPSSKDSWEVAVQVLDPRGGWIYAHENIAKANIESRRDEVVEIFTLLVKRHWGQGLGLQWEVTCKHLQQVKSYAPGVMHCVLDIAITQLE